MDLRKAQDGENPHILKERLSPLLKYPGGKEKELNYILPALPKKIKNYYEPFVGGGAVYFSVQAETYFINDKSDELILLYQMVQNQDPEFFEKLEAIEYNWNKISEIVDRHGDRLVRIYLLYRKDSLNKQQLGDEITQFVLENAQELKDLLTRRFNYEIENFVVELCRSMKSKMVRMKKIEQEKGELSGEDILLNMESALKAAFYTHFRYLMNHREELQLTDAFASAVYFFIRQTCYSSMFRYNRNGKFNVPYGGISYNRKSFAGKIAYYREEKLVRHLGKTVIGNLDFYEFMQKYRPDREDFVFLDPPYDTEFSTYARNEFNKDDQARLADYLIRECEASFMIVIKNTEYIASLYPPGMRTANGGRLRVMAFDKKYMVSFQDRNDKEAQHLLITNYEQEPARSE